MQWHLLALVASGVAQECFESDIDLYGNDLPGQPQNILGNDNVIQCQRMCNRTSGCFFFTINPANGDCYLKSGDSGRQVSIGITSGPRFCPTDPPTATQTAPPTATTAAPNVPLTSTPTSTPTTAPTSTPTTVPTITPTSTPTTAPASTSTTAPTSAPTIAPPSTPATAPSSAPTPSTASTLSGFNSGDSGPTLYAIAIVAFVAITCMFSVIVYRRRKRRPPPVPEQRQPRVNPMFQPYPTYAVVGGPTLPPRNSTYELAVTDNDPAYESQRPRTESMLDGYLYVDTTHFGNAKA